MNDQETILFFAGTDSDAAGAFVEENKESPGNSRESLNKQFTGEAYAAGGGYFVATTGRVTNNGGSATGTPEVRSTLRPTAPVCSSRSGEATCGG